ncbi:hypothetical protein F511_29184 [Dorcoceras hygrometricum]|uniref:Uncharacterized protein n=1 Tax=Dorcoceras hygrometricum TaxID=472368 RepID=A0A2Z7DG28_9LAMI|nr:hypothetical protein F511_29184 [Dorcoceras hygrometricum]
MNQLVHVLRSALEKYNEEEDAQMELERRSSADGYSEIDSADEKRCARYGMSCDDISLDVITISSWLSADEAKAREEKRRRVGESADEERRVIAACGLLDRVAAGYVVIKPNRDDKRNSDRRRHCTDKKPHIKRRDRKVLVAEESKIKWVDSDLDEITTSISSSDSEEDVQCLMADDTDEKLSQTFEEVKAKNKCLKDKSEDARCLQLDESDSIKNELSKLHEVQKPFNDRTGLGFSSGKSSSSDTSTQSYLTYDKLKRMSFVKVSMMHDILQSVKYDDQIVSKMNKKGKFGIGYFELQNSKPSCIKNRLAKDRARADSQSSICTSRGVLQRR